MLLWRGELNEKTATKPQAPNPRKGAMERFFGGAAGWQGRRRHLERVAAIKELLIVATGAWSSYKTDFFQHGIVGKSVRVGILDFNSY